MNKCYVFAVIEDNAYSTDETFDDMIKAIDLALCGYEITVLDAVSLEFYGTI